MQKATGWELRTIVYSHLVISQCGVFRQPEWNAAFNKPRPVKKDCLIPVRIEECDPIQMGLLRSRVYIELVGVSEPKPPRTAGGS